MATQCWCGMDITRSWRPGYDVYHLNFLAGTSRSMMVTEDPEHVWLRSIWKQPDPRLPMVGAGKRNKRL